MPAARRRRKTAEYSEYAEMLRSKLFRVFRGSLDSGKSEAETVQFSLLAGGGVFPAAVGPGRLCGSRPEPGRTSELGQLQGFAPNKLVEAVARSQLRVGGIL